MRNDLPLSLYQNLKEELKNSGLFVRRYEYYLCLSLLILVGYGASIFILTLEIVKTNVFLIILDACFLAFISLQLGMLGHDLSHKQVFKSDKLNKNCATICWTFFNGISELFWADKHTAHHKDPNHFGADPDTEHPFSFTELPEVYNKYVWFLPFRPIQHILFFIVIPFIYLSFTVQTFFQLFKSLSRRALLEIILVMVHFILLFGIVYSLIGFFYSIIFFFTMFLVGGIYMSLVFAPNHKGMEVISEKEKTYWYHQIICTRNLHPNILLFHIMGGLNYQIEHHLSPDMPRINYIKAAPIVKEFCKKNNISYYETGWLESLAEIYHGLKHNTVVSK